MTASNNQPPAIAADLRVSTADRGTAARGWKERLRLPLMVGVPLLAGG